MRNSLPAFNMRSPPSSNPNLKNGQESDSVDLMLKTTAINQLKRLEQLCLTEEHMFEIFEQVLDIILEAEPSKQLLMGFELQFQTEMIWHVIQFMKNLFRKLNLCRVDHLQPLVSLAMDFCKCPHIYVRPYSQALIPTISKLSAPSRRRSSLSTLKDIKVSKCLLDAIIEDSLERNSLLSQNSIEVSDCDD